MGDHGLRFVCRWVDIGAACNVGGPVEEGVRTFDDVEELARWLRFDGLPEHGREYMTRSVIGVEVLPEGEVERG